MSVPKGGRGKKQPYTTKPIRIPSPLFDQVESLLNSFYNPDKKNQADDHVINLIKDEGDLIGDDSKVILRQFAVSQAVDILAQNKVSKKSTKYCFEKLLQVLFDDGSIKL